MVHTAEPLLAITQSIPVKAQFLEKGNADLVALKDIEELVFFGFSVSSDPFYLAIASKSNNVDNKY